MRLIDVNTLELKEFLGRNTPRYAILSHTWNGNEEVTFQEWEYRNDDAVRRKEGYAKIVAACRCARANGLQYLWCDTNCIDKRSSAELSEAINSMFTWYHDSHVCYAYLADVEAKTGTFAKSRWFTRGWTLQELLAPITVVFYDYRWTVLGDRSELADTISSITRIHIGALRNLETIPEYSIAQRMSWAADRQTSREEDVAYCLLGIFSINMPLLYGEGQKAFTRLQQEIIKVSDDQSLLAWEVQEICGQRWTNALAPSPAGFRFCGSIVREWEIERSPYSVTNLGISMKLPMIETLHGKIALVGLNCAKELWGTNASTTRHRFQFWIPLSHLERNIYLRRHHPSSSIFLGRPYLLLTSPEPVDIFLTTDAPRIISELEEDNFVDFLGIQSPLLHSGLVTTIASGEMMPRGRMFKEVYPLGRLSIIVLKKRGRSKLSHQLVSSGSLTVIISIFWDRNLRPQVWSHTTIKDPNMQITRQMTSEEDWRCLFGTCRHLGSTNDCDTITMLHSLHKQLRSVYGKPMGTFIERRTNPVVSIDEKPLQDIHGWFELVVDIVFREKPTVV